MTRGWRITRLSLILLTVLLFTAGNGFSLGEEDQAVMTVVAAMQRVLKLTDAQVKPVTSVIREYVRQVQELKAEGVVGTDLQRKMKSLRDDMDSDLAHYLTVQQMTLWKRQTVQATERGNKVAARDGLASDGDRVNPSAVGSRSPKDEGVLESGSSARVKSSGVW